MLVVFSPIIVAETKITFVYNFVAPLKKLLIKKKQNSTTATKAIISKKFQDRSS